LSLAFAPPLDRVVHPSTSFSLYSLLLEILVIDVTVSEYFGDELNIHARGPYGGFRAQDAAPLFSLIANGGKSA